MGTLWEAIILPTAWTLDFLYYPLLEALFFFFSSPFSLSCLFFILFLGRGCQILYQDNV